MPDSSAGWQLTRSEIETRDTTALTRAAAAWKQAAAESEAAFEQHRSNISSPGGTTWEGDARDAAMENATTACRSVGDQVYVLREAASIAEEGATAIDAGRRETIAVIAAAENDGFKVGDNLVPTDTRRVDVFELANRRRAAAEHAEDIRWHADRLLQTDMFVKQRLQAKAVQLEAVRLPGENEAPDNRHSVQFVDHTTLVGDELPMYGSDGNPHPGDVKQRDIGDCYFEAALIAVADKDPERLKDMIYKLGDKYYVSGMRDRYGNPIVDYPITEKDLDEVLKHHAGQKVLWPAVLEAAAAKTRGGGNVAEGLKLMDGGDTPGAGLEQLTGKVSYTWFPGGGRDENDLMDALNSGKPVVMGTSMSATPFGVDPHRDGLAASHVYAISSAHRDPDGTVWAEIVNPWQYNAGQGDSGVPVVQIDPSTPGRAWLNLSDALSHHGVTAFVEGR